MKTELTYAGKIIGYESTMNSSFNFIESLTQKHNYVKSKDTELCYNEKTPAKLVLVLERLFRNKRRFRLWYGKDGKSWNEENDVCGTIGRSTGVTKIPLLISRKSSFGGGALMDDSIIKLVDIATGEILYQHENFNQSIFTVSENSVLQDGDIYANCKSNDSAKRLCDFMNGKRNNK